MKLFTFTINPNGESTGDGSSMSQSSKGINPQPTVTINAVGINSKEDFVKFRKRINAVEKLFNAELNGEYDNLY